MTHGTETTLTEEDWLKVQYELGARLHRREYDAESESLKRDWHFTHWLGKHGSAFFAFFRARRQSNPQQLTLWWKSHHSSDPKPRVDVAVALSAWDEIVRAWDAFPKAAALEAA